MKVRSPEAFARLVTAVIDRGRVVRARPLSGGMSALMTELEVECPGGGCKRFVHRVPAGGTYAQRERSARREHEVLQLVADAGLPAPAPVFCDSGAAFFEQPGLLMTAVDGAPDYHPRNMTSHVGELARVLADIHEVGMGGSAALEAHPGVLTADYRAATADIDPSLRTECINTALQQYRYAPPNRDVLLHGDYWPGNILWRAQRLVAVVDWEDASTGDPLVDLGNTRLELAWIFGLDAMNEFTARYQTRRDIDYRALAAWDLAAALRLARIAEGDFALWAASWHGEPFHRPDITEASLRADYEAFLEQAFANLGSRALS